MRCLIFGGDGMLGHRLAMTLAQHHDVRITIRGNVREAVNLPLPAFQVFDQLDVTDQARVRDVVATYRPDAVINAAGIIKQRPSAADPAACFAVNTVFPHRLYQLAQEFDYRLVHISTDCVFSGTRGYYSEDDQPDATDVYGVSKYWGELRQPPAITLRTSIIGLELKNRTGLVEWFLSQCGTVRGYRRAIFSGLTTAELSRLLHRIMVEWPSLHGVWHVASQPITKFDLLSRLKSMLARHDLRIVADDHIFCDRSLNPTRFEKETGYHAPSWDEMLQELVQEIQARNHRSFRDYAA
jgi:dTDP-4-dehydrorhamnose reductase